MDTFFHFNGAKVLNPFLGFGALCKREKIGMVAKQKECHSLPSLSSNDLEVQENNPYKKKAHVVGFVFLATSLKDFEAPIFMFSSN